MLLMFSVINFSTFIGGLILTILILALVDLVSLYEELKVKMRRGNTHTYEGEPLYSFGHGTPEYFSKLCRPKTTDEFISQLTDYYKMRMDETCGFVLPCDSYFI